MKVRRYRREIARIWRTLNPAVLPAKRSGEALFALASEVKKRLKKSPTPVDLSCTIISNEAIDIALLLPSGHGKTQALLDLLQLFYRESGNTIKVVPPRFPKARVFCSDMAWVSEDQGQLCFCRPFGESAIFAWDLARRIARDKLGIAGFEKERKKAVDKRLHSKVFGKLLLVKLDNILTKHIVSVPKLVIVGGIDSEVLETNRSVLTNEALIKAAIGKQASSKSKFWRSNKALRARLAKIFEKVRVWPKIIVQESHPCLPRTAKQSSKNALSVSIEKGLGLSKIGALDI